RSISRRAPRSTRALVPACVPLLVLLAAGPARADEITVAIDSGSSTGSLPTWYEPSAFFGWTSKSMRAESQRDAGRTHGLSVESPRPLLGPSTTRPDYRKRLADSGFAAEGKLIADAAAQLLIQVQAMPRWISSSSVEATPPGCEEEWPTYQ